jgi:hypothetical protein
MLSHCSETPAPFDKLRANGPKTIRTQNPFVLSLVEARTAIGPFELCVEIQPEESRHPDRLRWRYHRPGYLIAFWPVPPSLKVQGQDVEV